MAVLARTFQQLYQEVGRYFKGDASLDGGDTAKVKRWVNEGYWELLAAHDWAFLSPDATLTLWPTTTTGAVTVGGTGNKTLTVAAATFLPSMVGHAIVADDSGNSYTIDGYTSSTVITVTASAATDNGDTFTITADGNYTLPADFAGLADAFVYVGENWRFPLTETTPEAIRFHRTSGLSGDPAQYAIVPGVAAAAGQRQRLMVWPTPGQVLEFSYRYRIAAEELSADADMPLGGPAIGQAVLAAGLMIWERRMNQSGHEYRDLFYGVPGSNVPGALAQAIAADSRLRPGVLGSLIPGRQGVPLRVGPLTEVND